LKHTMGDKTLVEYVDSESFTTMVKTVDFSKAIKDLDHNPVVDPDEGIRRTTEWMKHHYRI